MLHDPIVEEVRQYRDAYSKRFHYDLKAISLDLLTQQEKSNHKKVTLPPKLVKTDTVLQH